MGQSWPLFVYFCPFFNTTSINSIQIRSSDRNRTEFEKNDEINCAYINSKLCNFGLNMSFVNVMIFLNEFVDENKKLQMIGRAHRNPRTDALKIYYMKPVNKL